MKQVTHTYKGLIIFLGLVLFSFGFLDKSYGQGYVKATYDISVPLGNTLDFIGRTSYRGFGLEMGTNLSDRFALGIKTGLHSFYESINKNTYTSENVTTYGRQFRYINSIPVLLTATYFNVSSI